MRVAPPQCMDEAEVRDALRAVLDPELGVNVVDLGLVRKIEIEPSRLSVVMTMTSPACPLGDLLVMDVRRALAPLAKGRLVAVDLVWDPPWTPASMSDAARRLLG